MCIRDSANAEPPEPFAPNTAMSNLLLLADGSETGSINTPDGKTIQVYCLYPIHQAEKQLVDTQGVEALLKKFQQQGVSTVFEPQRKPVS